VEDVATRVITANQVPDHTTIARFRQRHETVLGGLFGEVLARCAETGLVSVGVIAIDGTKVKANALQRAARDFEQIAREILEEADAVDAEEAERFGERRGDELPPESPPLTGAAGGRPLHPGGDNGSGGWVGVRECHQTEARTSRLRAASSRRTDAIAERCW
jgi:hypothetical protein